MKISGCPFHEGKGICRKIKFFPEIFRVEKLFINLSLNVRYGRSGMDENCD
jgi:hypothetical protein